MSKSSTTTNNSNNNNDPTPPLLPYWKELQSLDHAVTAAIELVQTFAEQEVTTPESCWEHPDQMLQQLNTARQHIVQAWETLQHVAAQQPNNKDTTTTTTTTNAVVVEESDWVRVQFMDMITTAFADVLTELQEQQGDNDPQHPMMDVNILVDCLQSGLDLFTQQEQELLLEFIDDNDNEKEEPSIHEKRRRELGFV
jgi:hypothetical protein